MGSVDDEEAFSLVEVVLALGIASFSLLLLLALLPTGIRSNRDSFEESEAVNILQTIIADRRVSPRGTNSSTYGFPALTNTASIRTGIFGVAENGRTVVTNWQSGKARYRLDYAIYPPASARQPTFVYMKVTWPAMMTTNGSSVETVVGY